MENKINIIFKHETDNGIFVELGIDNTGKLYWNKEPVQIEQKIKLQGLLNISIIIASFSTLIIAVFTIISFCIK